MCRRHNEVIILSIQLLKHIVFCQRRHLCPDILIVFQATGGRGLATVLYPESPEYIP